MVPLIVHPVLVNAAVLPTPTSPVVVDLVQVTAGPPRMAKPDSASPGCAEEEGGGFAVEEERAGACAVEERPWTSNMSNDARMVDSAVSRDTVDIALSWKYVGRRGDPSIHLSIQPCSPRYES